jgi:DNA-binding NarL/FixJ family response regulator
MKPIKVVVADDQRIIREGVKIFLESDEIIEIIGYAADGQQALDAVNALNPDVIILDLEMPKIDGWKLIKKFGLSHPHLKIIVLSAHQELQSASKAIKAGARGYMPKSSLPEELIWAIRLVESGYSAIDFVLLSQILNSITIAPSEANNHRARKTEQLRYSTALNSKNKTIPTASLWKSFKKVLIEKKVIQSLKDFGQKMNSLTQTIGKWQFSLKFVHLVIAFCCSLSLVILIGSLAIALD